MGSVQDVRGKRGADVGSDHVLLWVRIKLSLRSKKHVSERKKFDVDRLRSPAVVEQFRLQVYNRYEVLEDCETDDVNEYWMELRDSLRETAEEVLGVPKKKKK